MLLNLSYCHLCDTLKKTRASIGISFEVPQGRTTEAAKAVDVLKPTSPTDGSLKAGAWEGSVGEVLWMMELGFVFFR